MVVGDGGNIGIIYTLWYVKFYIKGRGKIQKVNKTC